MLGMFVFWSFLLVIIAFMSVRFIATHQCMLVKRGARIIRFRNGFNFLIPFYDKVIADFSISASDIVLCNFSVNGGEYKVIGNYKIDEKLLNEEILPIIGEFPQVIASTLQHKLNNTEESIESMDLKVLAQELETEVYSKLLDQGISISDLKIIEKI